MRHVLQHHIFFARLGHPAGGPVLFHPVYGVRDPTEVAPSASRVVRRRKGVGKGGSGFTNQAKWEDMVVDLLEV